MLSEKNKQQMTWNTHVSMYNLESYQVHICSSQINNFIRCIQLVHEKLTYNVLIHKQAHQNNSCHSSRDIKWNLVLKISQASV